MFARRTNVNRLAVLRDFHDMYNRFFTSFARTVLVDQFNDLIIVGILQIVAIFVNRITFLEILVNHQSVVVGKWVLFKAHQAAIDH
jgi:hypothetical protein